MKREVNRKEEQTAVFASWDALRRRIKDGTFREILEDWKWILGYSRRYKGAIALYVIFGILGTSFALLSSVATKYTIDIITGYKTEQLPLLIALMVGGAVIQLVFDSVVNRISAKIGIQIHNDIQAHIFDQIMDADWLSLGRFTNGDILNRFNSDISTVSGNAISWLPTVLIALYRFTAAFIVLFCYDKIMAVIALAGAPVILLSSRYLLKKQREYGKKVREAGSELMTFEVEALYNMDTVKSFGAAPQYSRRMRGKQGKFREISLKHNLFTIGTNALLSGLSLLVQFASFGYCLFLLWNRSITYGTMTLFLQQRTNLSGAFNSLVGIVPAFMNSSVSAHRIRELVELPREQHLPESRELDSRVREGFAVELRDVDFSYNTSQPVLRRSAMRAKPGEIIALVGASGEGKTTLIRLILGLVRPDSGEAVLRTKTGETVPMNAETRHLFAYVPQGNTILSGTIAENMRMVREEATDAEIVAALKTACAWEFVEKMPEGIHSTVGERGKGLSEGQAQRVAIARAILRDAPILLLDEATSALDVATERQVLKNIVAGGNRTCIVTTHRPSVLNLCSRTYRVMETEVRELSEAESSRMAMDF